MDVELLQLEFGVNGCSNTNKNENYYLLSSRGVDSFVEVTVKNKLELVLLLVQVRGLKVNEAHNFVTGYVYKINRALHRVKESILKIHPCQRHQLGQLQSI